MLFSKSRQPAGAPEYLIVGLGNPGRQYEITRHNAGFLCMDLLADRLGVKINKIKFKSVICDTTLNGRRCILMKPQTFMNLSGEAVEECCSFYKIPPEKVIVIFDDVSLPCGGLRIRRKGSDGGHNGIKSIILLLNSDRFPRIKLGIGAKPNPDYDLADYVLSRFTKEDTEPMKQAMARACDALELMVDGQIDEAMSRYSH